MLRNWTNRHSSRRACCNKPPAARPSCPTVTSATARNGKAFASSRSPVRIRVHCLHHIARARRRRSRDVKRPALLDLPVNAFVLSFQPREGSELNVRHSMRMVVAQHAKTGKSSQASAPACDPHAGDELPQGVFASFFSPSFFFPAPPRWHRKPIRRRLSRQTRRRRWSVNVPLRGSERSLNVLAQVLNYLNAQNRPFGASGSLP